jgi:hypothetical protein
MVKIISNGTTTQIITNSSTTHTTATASTIAQNSISAYIPYIVLGIIAIAGIIVIAKLLGKRQQAIKKNVFFLHLYKLLNLDMLFNDTKNKRILIGNKKYRIVAMKKEKINDKELIIMKIKTSLFGEKIVFLNSTIDLSNDIIYAKDINFYSLSEYFLIQADIFSIVENYLRDIGLFRISYENILNNLERSRLSERVVESNAVADSVKIAKEQTENYINILEKSNEIRKI